MATIEVVQATFAHVTDLGRTGYSRCGIPVNGAADQLSAQIANALVGNPVGSPLIEVVATDFAFRTEDFLLMAVSGAAAEVEVDGYPRESGQPVCVEPGSLVRLSGINAGLRCYLAIRGSFRVPRLLGSCAPDPMLGAGGSLTAGTRLDIDSTYQSFKHPHLPQPLFRFDTIDRTISPAVTIDVIRGPHSDQFRDGADVLASNQYVVCADSNHVGLRLRGPAPARDRRDELLSRGVPLGAVEIPPSEELIVLLRGRMVTAGYPVIAVATRTSRDTLGQLGAGNIVKFRYVTVETAICSYREQIRSVDRLRARVNAALAASGVPDL